MIDDEFDPRLDQIETQWSLLRRAHDPGASTVNQARSSLVLRYSAAISGYIGGIMRSGDADEIAQDAVIRLLKGDFAGADPDRGRFRDLLKTSLRNMIRNHWRESQRRQVADCDIEELNAPEESLSQPWLDAWTQNLLQLTWSRLEDYERRHPGSYPYTVLKLRTDYPDEDSTRQADRLSALLGREVRADSARQQLRRARLRFAEFLLQEVAQGLDQPTPDEIEAELITLGLLEYVRGVLPDDWKQTLKS